MTNRRIDNDSLPTRLRRTHELLLKMDTQADVLLEAALLIEHLSETVRNQEEELLRTWFAIKKAGSHPGRTDDRLSDCVEKAIAAEREACAKVCEETGFLEHIASTKECAAAIRARGTGGTP